VRQAYIDRSEQFPDRIKLIDSSQTVEHTKQQIKVILDSL
jgi:dTMP kinase